MASIGFSYLDSAAWNSFLSLGYLATGAAGYLLTRGLLSGDFQQKREEKSMRYYLGQAVAIAAGLAISVQMATWAERDVCFIPKEEMIRIFGVQAVLAVAAGYFLKAPRFALLLAGSSLNGYFGGYAVATYGGAGVYLAYEFLDDRRRKL